MQIQNTPMASSASSSHFAPASSSRSCKYDVFLSFRGEDTRKKFVDHLFSALKQHLIHVYKDDEALPRGESINQSLFEAIEESRIAVVVFSENYADSSWCLDELAHIMKFRSEKDLIVIPIFYDVEPTEVRNQKRKFGEAFAKQEAINVTKTELWRKALVDASNISGWEPKNIADGHESKFIKNVVDTILDKLFMLDSCVDEDIVGMMARLQDLESLLDIGSDGARMVGIWGVGGGGKTTLATSVHMKISRQFDGHCIVENVREETTKYSLSKVQENILSALFKSDVKVNSVAEGKLMMKSMLCRRKVLLLLDDVDKLDQLEALAGNHNWFGSGSRILITTRDEHLLRTHKVGVIYPIKLLLHDEAIRLFKRCAYNEEDPVEDYETLSLSVVSYCAGLPLAIKVLGSFLCDKNKTEWKSTMDRLKDIPETEIVEKLKISYDGLKTTEKELFLDIACFFRHYRIDDAMEMLDACGYYPEVGIKVLMQKALITIVNGKFDMHDLVQEMGHYIVRGNHPNNPEKHSRLWKRDEIENLLFGNETMEYDKIEAIIQKYPNILSHLCKIVSNMKKLRLLNVSLTVNADKNAEGVNFLSNELRYIHLSNYPSTPFPHSFQPVKLVVLKLDSIQKEVWKDYKHLPCLKVLELRGMHELLSTPNFDGLPRLEKLTLDYCNKVKEIHPSLGNHTSLEYLHVSYCQNLKRNPTISQMKNIKTLIIRWCDLKDGEIPCGIGELSNLVELNLMGNSFTRLNFSLSQLTRLKCLNLSNCDNLLELPKLPSSLAILTAYNCKSLTVEDLSKYCNQLCQVLLDKYGSSHIKLLQSMLKGNAIENGSMYLRLIGVEIPKGFAPALRRGRSCRLKLPENWCDDFSGFLICGVHLKDPTPLYPTSIRMKQVSSMDFNDDVVWEESDGDSDNMVTLVIYVSFGSLRNTTWWDPTYKYLHFDILNFKSCDGFGVTLVDKKSTVSLTKTSSPYTPEFIVVDDSASKLEAKLIPYVRDIFGII